MDADDRWGLVARVLEDATRRGDRDTLALCVAFLRLGRDVARREGVLTLIDGLATTGRESSIPAVYLARIHDEVGKAREGTDDGR